jgi:hypothetical protein
MTGFSLMTAEGTESEKFELRSSNFEIFSVNAEILLFFAALPRPKKDYFRAGMTKRAKRSMDLSTLS